MLESIDDNFLRQQVTVPTRESSILDLVMASQYHLINTVIVSEHLGSCDHKVVRTEINTTTNIADVSCPRHHQIFIYCVPLFQKAFDKQVNVQGQTTRDRWYGKQLD